MSKIIIGIVVLGAILVGAWIWKGNMSDSGPVLLQSVTYSCDGDKTIVASYYESRETPEQSQEGELPIPTGSVEVSFDGGEKISLVQTISASGIRYANADESLVFWSKGDEAIVMRDNEMDLDYSNCTATDTN